MSEDFDLKVFRAYPQSEPPVGTIDKGPSRKAIVTGVVVQFTLLTIATLGNGAVLFFSFARDTAIQADLKSLRLDVAKLDSVLNKARVEGWNVNLKQNLGDDTALIEQFKVISQVEKKINETIMTLHKDLENANASVAETLETNVMKTATHQPVDANEEDNVLQLTLKKLYNLSDNVNYIAMMQQHMKTSLTTIYDKLYVGIERKDATVTQTPYNEGKENVHLKEETSETAFSSQVYTSLLNEMRESLEDKLAGTLRNLSNALIIDINDELNSKQIYTNHTLNRMFEETNNSFELVLNALQNVSTHVISELNEIGSRYKKMRRVVKKDIEKLNLPTSVQMNIVNTTAEIHAILIPENNTDRISLIIRNTELNNSDLKEAKENITKLDMQLDKMTTLLEELSSNTEKSFGEVKQSINKLVDTQHGVIGNVQNKLSNGTDDADI